MQKHKIVDSWCEKKKWLEGQGTINKPLQSVCVAFLAMIFKEKNSEWDYSIEYWHCLCIFMVFMIHDWKKTND